MELEEAHQSKMQALAQLQGSAQREQQALQQSQVCLISQHADRSTMACSAQFIQTAVGTVLNRTRTYKASAGSKCA